MKTFLRIMVRALVKFTENDGWELAEITEFEDSTELTFELVKPYIYFTADRQPREIGMVRVTLKMEGVRNG